MLLKLVPEDTKIRFLHYRKVAMVVSLILMVASAGLFFARGLNLGIDFAGGIMLHIGHEQAIDIGDVRSALLDLELGDISVQEFGLPEEVLIRIEGQGSVEADKIAKASAKAALEGILGEVDYLREEAVGAKVSGELVINGILAVVFAVMAVLVYIWFRFEWHFGVGAVVALIHDVVLTIGLFALTRLEFNLSIIAAILTIVGYSLNDTVVVYDRIRENLRKFRKMEITDLLDLSINQTLSRTVMTSLTTLIALFSLFIFGGEVIRGFTAAMIWGVFVGTYSSVYIASPILIYLKLERTDMSLEGTGGGPPT
ncbi:MAG: protein translocase subunit SecF [Proteobacteria bacterium]|nr:protein translocase subunit SecF [Pseudomonadota bacterium]MCH8323189.1 protein translocase subunit SecF [Pseudomonadota bacterium]